MFQWLRLRATSAGHVGSIPGQEPRPFVPCGAAKRVKKKRKTTIPNPPFVQTICYSSGCLFFCLFHSLLIVKNLAPLIDNIVHELRNLGIYSVYPAISAVASPLRLPQPRPPCVLTFRIPPPLLCLKVPGLFPVPRYFMAFEATF